MMAETKANLGVEASGFRVQLALHSGERTRIVKALHKRLLDLRRRSIGLLAWSRGTCSGLTIDEVGRWLPVLWRATFSLVVWLPGSLSLGGLQPK